MILAGIISQIVQLVVSIRHREELRDLTGDPWNGRTLEWSTPSPPPPWNFPRAAACQRDRRLLDHEAASARRAGRAGADAGYAPIDMPKNTATGFVTAFFAVVTGFALIWHIWWMVVVGLFGALVTMLVFAWREQEEVEIPAAEVARVDREYRAEMAT